MSTLTLLFVAIALGTDAFSMAIGVGCAGKVSGRKIALMSSVVAIFHVFMPLIGLYLGGLLGQVMGDVAGWIGAIILAIIGIHMIREGFKGDEGELFPVVITSAWALLILAASVSLDALTVGFGLGTVAANIPMTVITLGIVAGLMTAMGLIFGQQVGRWLGEKAVIFGGVILLGIAVNIAFF